MIRAQIFGHRKRKGRFAFQVQYFFRKTHSISPLRCRFVGPPPPSFLLHPPPYLLTELNLESSCVFKMFKKHAERYREARVCDRGASSVILSFRLVSICLVSNHFFVSKFFKKASQNDRDPHKTLQKPSQNHSSPNEANAHRFRHCLPPFAPASWEPANILHKLPPKRGAPTQVQTLSSPISARLLGTDQHYQTLKSSQKLFQNLAKTLPKPRHVKLDAAFGKEIAKYCRTRRSVHVGRICW